MCGREGTHPFAPHPLLPPTFWAARPVPGLTVIHNLPGLARRAPLLPVPVIIAPQVHWDEEQLRHLWVLCPRWALLEVLVQELRMHHQ